MADAMNAKDIRPGHIVETADGCQFVVKEIAATETYVEIKWTDGEVERYEPMDIFDVVGEVTAP